MLNNISFKKQLKALSAVVKNENESIPCSIYKLEPQKDKNYFSKIPNKTDWQGSKFFSYINDINKFLKPNSPFSIYTLENKQGDCLGFVETIEFEDEINIASIETAPALSKSNSSQNSGIKYVGETLVTYLAKLAKSKFIPELKVEADSNSSKFFINKCFFRNYMRNPEFPDETVNLNFHRHQFGDLFEQNENHTGQAIKFLG